MHDLPGIGCGSGKESCRCGGRFHHLSGRIETAKLQRSVESQIDIMFRRNAGVGRRAVLSRTNKKHVSIVKVEGLVESYGIVFGPARYKRSYSRRGHFHILVLRGGYSYITLCTQALYKCSVLDCDLHSQCYRLSVGL